MNFDTRTAADYAAQKLDSMLERATRDSNAMIEQADIPSIVVYFADLKDTVKRLAEKVSALQKHVDGLSYEVLPTMMMNANVKTIKIDNVGRVSVNVRWSASLLNKETGFSWLRQTGNGGLIIETVNSQTLGAFAKEETIAGRPLPADIFKVGSSPYISITKD